MDVEQSGSKEIPKADVVCTKELEDCGGSVCELDVRGKKAEERCAELELEIRKMNIEYEELETKFRALEVEKLSIEDQFKGSKRTCDELKEQIACKGDHKLDCEGKKGMENYVDLTEENEEEDKVVQLLVEIEVLQCEKKRAESEIEVWKEKSKVLECEKKRAEIEVEVWKEKFEKLESRILQLDKNLVLRSGEQSLDGRVKVGLGPTGVHFKEVDGIGEMSELIKLKDGLHVGTDLDYPRTKKNAVELDTNHSPAKGIGDAQAAGTPYSDTPYIKDEKQGAHLEPKVGYGRRVRRHLAFKEVRSPGEKIAPATPGGAKPPPHGVIDICDSDDECAVTPIQTPTPVKEGNLKISLSTDGALGCEKEMTGENNVNDQSDAEDMDIHKENLLSISTPKRKRASNIVASDTETDDDEVPICRLKRMRLQELIPEEKRSDFKSRPVTATACGSDNVTGTATPPRRRIMTLRQCEGRRGVQRKPSSKLKNSETEDHVDVPTPHDVDDDELEDVGSESEGESLGGFIVDSYDVSESDNDTSSCASQDESDDNVDFGGILSTLQRDKKHTTEWEFEGDMLAAFGKDPELCMKAVCALYRQQTSDERMSKETLHYNNRGFSKLDADRGSELAEFITDGDPEGDIKKSVKELRARDVELCRTLATRYSKQLFEIYKNKEDPLFLPC